MTHDLKALRELETRIAEAKVPDREIDALIFNSLPNPERVEVAWKESDCTELRRLGCDAQFHDGWLIRKAGEYPAKYANDLPRFTASLDAAIALVERVLPGRDYTVRSRRKNPFLGKHTHEAVIWGPGISDSDGGSDGFSSSPALALCLAAIRALAGKAAE